MAASAFPMISECRTAHRKEDHATVDDSPVSIGPMIRRATFPSPSCPATHFGQLHRRCCHMPLRRVLHAEVVFVSSNRWDAMGATAFGFRSVWVNRAKTPDEYPDFPPGAVVNDLSGLLSVAR